MGENEDPSAELRHAAEVMIGAAEWVLATQRDLSLAAHDRLTLALLDAKQSIGRANAALSRAEDVLREG